MPFGPAVQWWRRALVAGATTAALLSLGACGTSHDATSGASPTGSSASGPTATGSSASCPPLPDSQVPPLQKALSETDRGTYCTTVGTSILVVLKASAFDAAHAWAEPSVTGPAGGVHQITVPLTALRGTTVAGFQVTAPGSYEFSSTTGSHDIWKAVVIVTKAGG